MPDASAGAVIAEAAEEPETAEPETSRRRRSRRRGSMMTAMAETMSEASEAPTPAVATTGRVNVVTPGGWAEIRTVGGRRLGTSPTTIRLPTGRQQIRILPFGQPPGRTVSVDVPENGTTPLVVPVRQ